MESELPSQEKIPKLGKDNYMIWKEMIEKHLRQKRLWGYVVGETIPEHEQVWAAEHAKVQQIFKKNCGPWVLPYIEGKGKARDVWSQLEIMYKEVDGSVLLNQRGMSTNYTWWLPLYRAIVEGDLKTFRQLVSKNKGVLTVRLTSEGEIPIHVAAQQGQVKIVEEMVNMMDDEKEVARQGKYQRSALHIAASDGNISIVKALVAKYEDQVMLKSEFYDYNIPITIAARAGNKKVVAYLYPITLKQDQADQKAFQDQVDQKAITQQDKADQKAEDTKERDQTRAALLISLIFGDFFDLALDLLQKYSNLVLIEDANMNTALDALSMKPSAFPSSFPKAKPGGFGLVGYYLESTIYSLLDIDGEHINHCPTGRDIENSSYASSDNAQGEDRITLRFCKGQSLWFHQLLERALKLVPSYETIYDLRLKHHRAVKLLKQIWKLISELDDLEVMEDEAVEAMFRATELGIVEFIDEIIDNCPQLLAQTCPWFNYEEEEKGNIGQTVFHYAIRNRQGKIFGRIHDLGPMKNDITRLADNSMNLMSHLAAMKAPVRCLNQVPGAALQVQHELLWYKEVERIMPPTYEEFENKEKKTARILFTEEHQELVKEGATWMKETATQCMVVATLITTIMFAAVFTVPGAKESDIGKPNYIHDKFSIVFVAANILALSSSVASILMFLAIITSRYAEEDFLKTLPQMLILGLFFLFLSIAGMMVEFVVAVLVLVHYNVLWISFPIVFLASVPITIYALVQFPLFIELTFATTRLEVFGKGRKK
ncbi:uncharacterized protein LOC122069742 isoform X2 [Macadamia integrifolia]|nr:uncharacterized protein LOC122069742 isoform X2 [Macadamia integrifolia]